VELQKKAVALLLPGETVYRWARERFLVRFMLAAGDEEAARRYHGETLDRLRKDYGVKSPRLWMRLVDDGWMLIEEGRPDLAEPLLLEAHAIMVRGVIDFNPAMCRRSVEGLVRIYEEREATEALKKWRTELEKCSLTKGIQKIFTIEGENDA
jgi:hypothetical protein